MNTIGRKNIRELLNKEENLALINQIICDNNNYTMNNLSRRICEDFGFIAENGKLKTGGCIVVLRELEVKNKITLVTKKNNHRGEKRMTRYDKDLPLPADIPDIYTIEMNKFLEINLVDLHDTLFKVKLFGNKNPLLLIDSYVVKNSFLLLISLSMAKILSIELLLTNLLNAFFIFPLKKPHLN